ncbi:MAG: LuxR C-terminal-related transcriptional regulator [Lacipirellulaceae bacterium]
MTTSHLANHNANGPIGLAVLIRLDDPSRSIWTAAAESVGAAPVIVVRVDEARVYAEGPRSTCVLAPVSELAIDPSLAPLVDPADIAFRRTVVIALAVTPDASCAVSRVAFAAAALAPTNEMAARVLLAGLAEAERRRADWDLVEDYHRRHASLTADELVVHDAVCHGKLNKQIARELGVSIRTVEQRRRRVFAKMGVPSAVPLVDRMATVRTLERCIDRHDSTTTPIGPAAPHLMRKAPASVDWPVSYPSASSSTESPSAGVR